MPDELNLRERAALLVLMAEGRELTNAELRDTAGLTIDGDCRRRLNDLGLVASTKVGAAFVHELTDRGALRCAAELSEQRPPRSGYAGGALYAVLGGLRRNIERTGAVLSDVLPPNVRARVVAAYDELTRGRGGPVRLADLRERLDGVSKPEVDRALETLARQSTVHLRAEANQKTLTERDHEAALVLGGSARHTLMIEGDE